MSDKMATLTLYEIVCLMCAEIVGRTTNPGTYQPTTPRCPRCGSRLQAQPTLDDPRLFGLVPLKQMHPDKSAPQVLLAGRCVDCGTPTARAKRCRRCYVRHRLRTQPSVRAKQLRFQAAWRKRYPSGAPKTKP